MKKIWEYARKKIVKAAESEEEDESYHKLNKKEKTFYYLSGISLCIGLGWLFFESILTGLLLSPILFFLENRVGQELWHRKKQNWELEFSKYLTNLDSSIRLGHSIETGMVEAAKGNKLFAEEAWMIKELEMNVYVADIFQKLAEKKKIESLRHFSSTLNSAILSGSNLHELILNNIFQIQKKIKMEIEIQSMMTKVKYESAILVGFVPFMLLYLKGLSPNFRVVMYGSLQGRIIMLVCLGIYMLASYLCYSMTQVEI